jgi:hypothetical protein
MVTAADAVASAEGGSESLGTGLLDDLDPSRFGPPAGESDEPDPPPGPAKPDFQKRILPGMPDDALGEDISQPSASGPLIRVRQNMEAASALIREPDTLDRAGELQEQVVADLDALIRQLAKQCQGACQSSGQSKSSSRRSQTAAAKPGSKPGRGSAPARDSTTRLGRGDPQAVDLAEREALLKDLWGHLPPHAREQMLQASSDEFLPEYELEIEKYFRRLAEEQGDGSPN